MRFFRNALSIFLTTGLALPFGLAIQLVLARWLSVDERGVYAFLISVVAIGFLLGSLGWTAASIYRLRRLEVDPARVAGTGTLANFAVSMGIAGLCWLGRGPICAAFLSTPVSDLDFGLAIAAVPMLVLGNYHRSLAQALDRFDLNNAYGFGQVVGVLAVLLVLVVWRGQGLTGALAANLAANVLLTIWLARRVLALTGFEWRIDAPEALGSLAFGLKAWVLHVAVQLHERLGIFVVGALIGDAAELAFYGIAIGTVARLNLVPVSSATALFPKLAGDGTEDAARFTVFVGRHSLLWVALILLVLMPAMPWFIPWIYGASYEPSIVPTLWLLPGMAGLTLARIVSRFFMSQDRQALVIAARLGSIAAALLLCVWWVPRFGITGAAAATSAGYGLEALVLLVAFARASGEGAHRFLAFESEDWRVYQRRAVAAWSRLTGTARSGAA